MFDPTEIQRCDLCKLGHVTQQERQIAFHQWTDKGYVFCHATIPVGICCRCDSEHWDGHAEAVIEEAVRREYEKLPYQCTAATEPSR
jgi:hypothetical protein